MSLIRLTGAGPPLPTSAAVPSGQVPFSKLIAKVKILTVMIDLIERSGELKSELVEFARRPRYDEAFRQVLTAHHPAGRVIQDGELIDVLDRLVLQHRLRKGQTILEQFVASRPDLLAHEREMLLAWRDVVEGIFEVVCREGEVLVVTNLVDELTYRVRSNMGGEVFRCLRPGSYMLARLVPFGSEWLVSGVVRPIDKGQRKMAYATAAELTMKCPRLLFRNPYYLERGWELQRKDRDRFVRFFGSDMAVVPGTEIAERMRQYQAFSRKEVLDEWEAGHEKGALRSHPLPEFDFPRDLVESGQVAMIYDETDGLGFFAGFGEFEQAFTDPTLLDEHLYLKRVADYLHDDSVSPLPFRRMAERHPGNATEVLRRVLRRKNFDWSRDGEKLMGQRKRTFFERAPMPSILPISPRLAPYIGSS